MHRHLLYGYMLILLAGCAGTKEFVKAKKNLKITEVLQMMQEHKTEYEWFSAKAKIDFKSAEESLSGRTNIRMVRDSLIWLNFKKLSIEGSRALMTRDTFFIVYRLDHMYETGTLKELLEAYQVNLSFEELQNYVVGNMLIPDEDEITIFETNILHRISFVRNNVSYEYGVDGLGRVVKVQLKDEYNRQVSLTVNNHDELNFGTKKQFVVNDGNGQTATIQFDFSQVEFNVPKNIAFEVPNHYGRYP